MDLLDATVGPEETPGQAAHAATPRASSHSFSVFYVEEWARAVRLATLIVGSSEAAEDIAQDAFVAVRRNWEHVTNPTAYLRTAVGNRCKNHLRGLQLRRNRTWGHDVPAELAANELWDALRTLPARQRTAIVLRYYGDYSLGEVAEALGCREGTVGSLINRGLAALRSVIQ